MQLLQQPSVQSGAYAEVPQRRVLDCIVVDDTTINQSINQHQSINQSINQSIKQSMDQSTSTS